MFHSAVSFHRKKNFKIYEAFEKLHRFEKLVNRIEHQTLERIKKLQANFRSTIKDLEIN